MKSAPLVKQGQRWRHVAATPPSQFPGDEASPLPLVHTVTEASSQGVVTWSDPLPTFMDNAVAGFTWFGPMDQFLKEFQPA